MGTVYVQTFDVALANWDGEPSGLCVHSKTCGLALALEHNGDLYSCDHFVEPDYRLGNILETPMIELIASPQQRQFGQDKFATLPRRVPRVRRALRVSWRLSEGSLHPDPRRRTRAELPVRRLQALLPHVDQPMRFMAEELRQDRAPSEIMRRYAAAIAAAGASPRPGATIPVRAAAARSSSSVTAAARDGACV